MANKKHSTHRQMRGQIFGPEYLRWEERYEHWS